jgi:hypothetical protein
VKSADRAICHTRCFVTLPTQRDLNPELKPGSRCISGTRGAGPEALARALSAAKNRLKGIMEAQPEAAHADAEVTRGAVIGDGEAAQSRPQ